MSSDTNDIDDNPRDGNTGEETGSDSSQASAKSDAEKPRAGLPAMSFKLPKVNPLDSKGLSKRLAFVKPSSPSIPVPDPDHGEPRASTPESPASIPTLSS